MIAIASKNRGMSIFDHPIIYFTLCFSDQMTLVNGLAARKPANLSERHIVIAYGTGMQRFLCFGPDWRNDQWARPTVPQLLKKSIGVEVDEDGKFTSRQELVAFLLRFNEYMELAKIPFLEPILLDKSPEL